MNDTILVAIGDPTLHAEANHIAAATGYHVVDTGDPREINRHFLRSHAVLVDAITAPTVTALPRRAGVFFLGNDPGPPEWKEAMDCHAEGAFLLPSQAPELLGELGHAAVARENGPGKRGAETSLVIAILGSAGGAGVSTLAGAVARRSSGSRLTTLIDGCSPSGGLDLLLGIEDTTGVRWPDLRLGEGAVSGKDLRTALPCTDDGIAVLSAARSTIADPFHLSPREILPVIDSLRGVPGFIILDLPPSVEPEILDVCDLVVLVVPAEVRSAAAAASMAAGLRSRSTRAVGIARYRAWSGLSLEDLEKLTHLDMIAEVGTITRLTRTTELSALPHSLPRPLATAADAIRDEAKAIGG